MENHFGLNIDDVLQELKSGTTLDAFTDEFDLTVSQAEDFLADLSKEGHEIVTVGTGELEYLYLRERKDDVSEDVNHVESTRYNSRSKQNTTKEVREYVEQLEDKIKKAREDLGSLEPSRERPRNDGNMDVVLHRSDDHFGDVVEDEEGNVVFNSDIAKERCIDSFNQAIEIAGSKERDVDTFHLLLGGDMVTNEMIYPHQPFDIDQTIKGQLDMAAKVYYNQIEKLSNEFPFVQVVCQHGNHGGIPFKGSSNDANVDDFLYNELELLCKVGGLENVKFVKSDSTHYTNFSMRGHRGHLRHGHNVNSHIGTSSPQSTWRNYLYNHDFDVAYRGHYHNHKIEHVSGKPVIMAPCFKPPGDYEEKMGVFGKPMSYVHGVTNESPLAWTEYINYDE